MSFETQPRALVTGISRGIGHAIATRLLSDGWEVEGTYRENRQSAEALAAAFPSLRIHQADFSKEEAVDDLLSAVQGPPFSGLVNNAGVIHFEDLHDFDQRRWRETLEVNLTTPVRLARALEPALRGGVVVNHRKHRRVDRFLHSVGYGVSKAALFDATKSLANLLARNEIRVVAVSPG